MLRGCHVHLYTGGGLWMWKCIRLYFVLMQYYLLHSDLCSAWLAEPRSAPHQGSWQWVVHCPVLWRTLWWFQVIPLLTVLRHGLVWIHLTKLSSSRSTCAVSDCFLIGTLVPRLFLDQNDLLCSALPVSWCYLFISDHIPVDGVYIGLLHMHSNAILLVPPTYRYRRGSLLYTLW